MSAPDLAELRRLREAATQDDGEYRWRSTDHAYCVEAKRPQGWRTVATFDFDDDAELYAQTMIALPALLDMAERVEALTRERDALDLLCSERFDLIAVECEAHEATNRTLSDARSEISRQYQRADQAEGRADALAAALKLHVAYEALPQDRGGKTGPKGRAWTAFIEARDAALAQYGEGA